MYNISFKNPKHWSTHMTMLMKAVRVSGGTVVEVGGGIFSTPLLHWMCKEMGRRLISYENDPEFFRLMHEFQSRDHSVRFIENWDDMDFKSHRGVVFIDHHPEARRGADAIRFKDSADFIVLHDTERPEKYGYDAVWQHFKYVYHWKDCRPWTSVVSNRYDINEKF